MELKFTDAQRRALQNENKNVIVSASAGTGKTTVMVEKIAALVISGKIKLSELLVVTFTKLAAGEMKKKLKTKLAGSGCQAAAEQLLEIDNCDISTLHGFCSTLIRRHFYFLGTDPAFIVLNEAEALIERGKIIETLFDGLYGVKDERFLKLTEIFSSGRTDTSLKDTVGKLYDFKICMPDFNAWHKDLESKYEVENGVDFYALAVNKRWTGCLMKHKAEAERTASEAFKLGLEKCGEFFSGLRARLEPRQNFGENLNYLRGLAFERFDVFCKADKEGFPEFYARASSCFYGAKKFAENEQNLIGEETPETALEKNGASFEIIRDLLWLTGLFEEKYAAEKKQKNVLDYNDLEHGALKILRDESLREQIKSGYKAVFVDEFQDTNEVQEEIISLVKSPGGLFLVGDVKQSIYAFRQCRPQIFTDTLKSFGENSKENAVVYMNDNFRSNTGILDFVNIIFDRAMSEETGGIDYMSTSRLDGKKAGRAPLPCVQLDLALIKKKTPCAPDGVYDISKANSGETSEADLEAEIIARRIGALVGQPLADESGGTRPVRFSDIVILTRAGKRKANDICSYLNRLRIPAVSEVKQPLFESTELKTLINFLKVVDNPKDDIALAAGLKGFFGGLTERELLEIRHLGEKCLVDLTRDMECGTSCGADNHAGSRGAQDLRNGIFFHQCVFAYMKKFEDAAAAKLKKFFALAERYRLLAGCMTPRELLSELINETDYRLYVTGLPGGDSRRVKTDKFVNSLEGRFFDGGLRSFLDYADRPSGTAAAAASACGDAVRIMTVHASKGLEFPVVILCDCGREFYFDSAAAVFCDPETGAGGYCYDIENKLKFKTVARDVIYKNALKKNIEEEMRLLYVAMTRAQNHLYIVGCEKDGGNGVSFDPDAPRCFLDWVFGAAAEKYGNEILNAGSGRDIGSNRRVRVWEEDELKPQGGAVRNEFKFAKPSEKNVARIKEDINFVYPHVFAASMPLKVSPSRLTPYGFDGDGDAPVTVLFDTGSIAETGTAYHKIFERADFSNRTAESVEQIIRDLKESGQITPETACRLKPGLVVNVLNKSLFDGIENKKVYRELPFMLKTRADYFFEGGAGETVFLQGVIDMLIIEDGRAAVVDFKYSGLSSGLKERYAKQLECYALAAGEILKIKDIKKYIVSVADGEVIEV